MRRRLPAGIPNPIDVHVGNRVRLRRTLLGLSQERLGDAVGLTFQQIQKYERGTNRISSSRLYQISSVLGVPTSYFFDDVPRDLKSVEGQVARGLSDFGKSQTATDPMTRRETLKLVRAYYRISSPATRKVLLELFKACAGASD